MYKINKVKVLSDYKIWLKYSDDIEGIIDLSDLVGRGVFSEWNDYDKFKNVKIGSSGELIWQDEVDLCPDSLYMKITGKTAEELFPLLKREPIHA